MSVGNQQREYGNMTTATSAAPKRKITIPKAGTKPAAPKLATTAEPPKKGNTAPARPSIALHKLNMDYGGVSGVENTRVSRTAIDYSKFGTMPEAVTTERDRAAHKALRDKFGNKTFQRSNVDAGILRRLGERGFIEHVSGASNEATATFRLTSKKLAA